MARDTSRTQTILGNVYKSDREEIYPKTVAAAISVKRLVLRFLFFPHRVSISLSNESSELGPRSKWVQVRNLALFKNQSTKNNSKNK